MKKHILFFLLIGTVLAAAHAGLEDKKIGAGFIIGDPTGLSFKSWTSSDGAIDGAVSWSMKDKGKFIAHINFLKHNFEGINIGNEKIPFYYGGGSWVKIVDENKFGVRGVAGLVYILKAAPIEFFGELGPSLELVPEMLIGATGGVGVRYYF